MGRTTKLLPDQLQAIGHVAARWALLEAMVHWAFCELLSLPLESGKLIAARIRRMDLLLQIINDRGEIPNAHRESWKRLEKDIKKLAKSRDDIIHRQWWLVTDDPRLIEGKKDTHVETLLKKLPPIKKTAEEIDEVAVQLSHVRLALLSFVVAIRGSTVSPFP